MPNYKQYSVYVIELDREVLKHKKFRNENPDYDGEKACLYVGMTYRTPDERYEQHKSGVKSNSYVRRYGLWLRRKLFEKYNKMTQKQAIEKEKWLADYLRKKGYAVYQK